MPQSKINEIDIIKEKKCFKEAQALIARAINAAPNEPRHDVVGIGSSGRFLDVSDMFAAEIAANRFEACLKRPVTFQRVR